MAPKKTTTKKNKKNIPVGIVKVNATFNNTIVSVTDQLGNVIAWSSAGAKGFKGSRKATPYAAQITAEDAGRKAQDHGVKIVSMEVKGPGTGRESALRAFQSLGMVVTTIKDVTGIPHNGCRAPKRRRV